MQSTNKTKYYQKVFFKKIFIRDVIDINNRIKNKILSLKI